MAKSRAQKQLTVDTLTDDLKRMKSVVFADFQGLKAGEIEEIRTKCTKAGLRYTVAKKTLLNRAFKANGIELDTKSVAGSLTTVIGFEDEVAPAKMIADYAKIHEALKVKGGVLEAKFVDAKTVMALAKLPSKNELIAKVLGSLNAPLSGLVNVLAGNLRGLVQVLAQIEKSKA
ncbi:MAG: 50S ribosomal protein L10 [bacterium]